MLYELILILYFAAWILLVAIVIVFCISGLDDLFYDAFYWIREAYLALQKNKPPTTSYLDLVERPEKSIAIIVAAWDEKNVIEAMLKHNCEAIDYENYDFFIGTYAIDPETVAAVQRAEKQYKNIRCVINTVSKPMGKAQNLNTIYRYIKDHEKEQNKHYEIFLMHDAEDIIHPLALKLYNYLMPEYDMIQTPVIPLEVSPFNFTHWTYNDEFGESHTKDIIVREAIGAFVPSAGVGTAFGRSTIEDLAAKHHDEPFAASSLTEDYHVSLSIHLSGLKQKFVAQRVSRTKWRRRFYFFGPHVPRTTKEYVATRAFFPTTYMESVRQKSRWVFGIAIQEWLFSGWPGGLATKYTLIHDRKAVITYPTNILSYFVLLFWVTYSIATLYLPEYPSLQERFNENSWVWYLIIIATIAMLSRILQRFIASFRLYGLLPAILSIPRIIYGNIISLHALLRAIIYHILGLKEGKSGKWEKTHHEFPSARRLQSYQKKLGGLLLKERVISRKQLIALLKEQKKRGKKLGELALEHRYLSSAKLAELVAKRYFLKTITKDSLTILPHNEVAEAIDLTNYNHLIGQHCYPIEFDENRKTIVFAIIDPFNKMLQYEIKDHLPHFKIEYVFIVETA